MLAGDRAVSILLKHAYMTLPYDNTLHTKAFTNYIFTLTLEMPSILQFDLTALNVRYASYNLSNKSLSGLHLSFAILIPKYLNSFTFLISLL